MQLNSPILFAQFHSLLQGHLFPILEYAIGVATSSGVDQTPTSVGDWKQWKWSRVRFTKLRRRGVGVELAAQTLGSSDGPSCVVAV